MKREWGIRGKNGAYGDPMDEAEARAWVARSPMYTLVYRNLEWLDPDEVTAANEESITHIIKLSARVAALEHALVELSSIGFAASDAGCAQELIVQRLIGGQDAS